jgi:hypothetical protein
MSAAAPASPKPLTDLMTYALGQLRTARADGNPGQEWGWTDILDGLLDRYLQGER